RDQLIGRHQNHLAMRGSRHDPLADERASVPLDEIEAWIHFVRPVDGQGERRRIQLAERNAELACDARGRLRGRYAGDAHPGPYAGGERVQKCHGRSTGPEPDTCTIGYETGSMLAEGSEPRIRGGGRIGHDHLSVYQEWTGVSDAPTTWTFCRLGA